MNRLSSFLTGILLIPQVLTAQTGSGTKSMSLQECIDYALQNNQNLQIAKIEVDRASAQVGEYLSEGFPQLNASADLRKNLSLRTTLIPAEFFGGEPGTLLPVQFGTPYDGDLMLSASQLLFDGSYFVGIKASKTLKELTYKQEIQSEIDVIANVTKAYYNVLLSKISKELIDKNYNRLDTLLYETRIMYENGFAEKITVNRIQVEFNNIKARKENNDRLIALSYQLLKFQMGMPHDESIELTDNLRDLNADILQLLEEPVSYNNRIEYSILNTNRMLASLQMRNTTAQYLPRLNAYYALGANAGVQSAGDLFEFDFGTNWFKNEVLGIRLELPIFDGLNKSYRVQRSKLELKQIDQSKNLLENSIELEAKQARINLTNALNSFTEQEKNMVLAEEVYNVTKEKYQEGVGSSIEIIDADNAFKESQTSYYNALYDLLVAKVDLEKSLGLLKKN